MKNGDIDVKSSINFETTEEPFTFTDFTQNMDSIGKNHFFAILRLTLQLINLFLVPLQTFIVRQWNTYLT